MVAFESVQPPVAVVVNIVPSIDSVLAQNGEVVLRVRRDLIGGSAGPRGSVIRAHAGSHRPGTPGSEPNLNARRESLPHARIRMICTHHQTFNADVSNLAHGAGPLQ
jgi:hypothetical protein